MLLSQYFQFIQIFKAKKLQESQKITKMTHWFSISEVFLFSQDSRPSYCGKLRKIILQVSQPLIEKITCVNMFILKLIRFWNEFLINAASQCFN